MIDTTSDKATDEWLSSFKRSSKKTYKTFWLKFLEYTNMTGDQILADRKTDYTNKEYKWEKKTWQFKQWMLQKPLQKQPSDKTEFQSDHSARNATVTVRSFFAYHRVPLQYRRQENKQMREAKRKTEDYKFSREDLKKMADVGNLKEKYVVVAGKSFGLRASDFCNLRRGDLQPYINREPPISIDKINTIKENVPAYPFIDTDAQPIIKMTLDNMARQGRNKPTDKMLEYKQDKELSQVLKRLAVRAGIETGNKRVRFHCLRKFLIDNLSRFMSESKWKQIVGKLIDESAYVSPDSLREDYIRVMPETTFEKVLPQAEIELLAKKQALLIIAKNAGISEEELKRIFTEKKATTLQAQVEVLETLTFKDRVQARDSYKKEVVCPDGEHCQRLVTEEQLEVLLTQGWRVVVCLPSGKIVVSNEY